MGEIEIKELRKGMKELKARIFPYRHDYHYGYHDAIELCNKLITQQMRKYDKLKKLKNKEI